MSTNDYNQPEDDISVNRVSEDDFTPAQQSSQFQITVSTFHGASTLPSDSNDCTVMDEISDDKHETTVSEQLATKEVIKVRASSPPSDILDSSEVEKTQSEDDISVYIVSKDEFSSAQQSPQFQIPVSTFHGASTLTSNSKDCTVVDEISDDENETTVSEQFAAKEVIKVRAPSPSSDILDSSEVEKQTTGNESSSYENKRKIFLAVFVRSLLIVHNIVTAWRVTEAYNDDLYWLIVLSNLAIIAEGLVVIFRRGGIEYSWWCPCFLVYLLSVIPSIWLLKLDQHYKFIASQRTTVTTSANIPFSSMTASTPILSMSSVVVSYSTEAAAAITTSISSSVTTSSPTSAIRPTISSALYTFSSVASLLNTTVANIGQTETIAPNKSISKTTGTTISSTTKVPNNTTVICSTKDNEETPINAPPDSDAWVIIVSNAIVYLIVFGRWLLPRGRVSRDFLADLLLEYLAMASDIMELLAFVDDKKVSGKLQLTHAILAVWSITFIQFIPIPTQKKRSRISRKIEVRCITRLFGDQFMEFMVTCMSILLQDLPFFVIRLYIAIGVNLITYSLIFFLLKNIVSLMLLFYRLVVISHSMPFCKKMIS